MSSGSIPLVNSTINYDTTARANTVATRDSQGGLTVATLTASELVTTGGMTGNVVTETASFTAGSATDYLCDATSAAITVTLPLASANVGVVYWFTKKDSSANAITLTGVLGTGTLTSQYQHVRVFSDGTNWYSAA
jgi:hypothetical protein